jgi:hypothetical protein
MTIVKPPVGEAGSGGLINFWSILPAFSRPALRYLANCSLFECSKELELFGLINVFRMNNIKLQNLIHFLHAYDVSVHLLASYHYLNCAHFGSTV